MGRKKTTEERLQEKMEEMNVLSEQIKVLKARQKEEDRKKKLDLQIKIGKSVESVLGRDLEFDDVKKLEKYLKDQDSRGGYFTKAMNKQQKSIDNQSDSTDHQKIATE
ncbi:MAG: relaxasome subunit MobC [Lachnospiraceae bacterium]|nr:relaxasome subunit MobC [Lachnospiraceae bacterium]